jgi:hypothetical protein
VQYPDDVDAAIPNGIEDNVSLGFEPPQSRRQLLGSSSHFVVLRQLVKTGR